jgi:hypothetical protein
MRTLTLPASSADAHRAPSTPGGRSIRALRIDRKRDARDFAAGPGEVADHVVEGLVEHAHGSTVRRRAGRDAKLANMRVRGHMDLVLEQPELGDGVASDLGVRHVECGWRAPGLIGHWVGHRCCMLCVEGAEDSRGARVVGLRYLGRMRRGGWKRGGIQ